MQVYAETSIFGALSFQAAAQFRIPSEQFFDKVRAGQYELVVSAVVEEELSHPSTPAEVVLVFREMVQQHAVFIADSPEARRLRDAYLAAGVLKPAAANDALHVAYASVAGVPLLTSWDRGELVKVSRIAGFNQVNAQLGYGPIQILLPSAL